MAAETAQKFGSDPVSIRDTDHYTNEYVSDFVDKWDSLIDWDQRAKSEGSFFIDVLRQRGARKVLDVATGTGFHSCMLLEAGFEVVSADGSAEMLVKAFENGRRRGHILRTVLADWRWLNRDVHGEYDAIICLGNSFTHLFEERDRRKALAEFYAMLRHNGVLILDQRNYDAILDHGFSSSHTYYYCGDEVRAEPEHVDEGLARFCYSFKDNTKYHLNMYPLRKSYTRRLMHEVGFQRIKTYGDFKSTYREDDPDFFIHVAEKFYDLERVEEDEDNEEAVETAREYYNSEDADNFYYNIWGGEDIHVGWYQSEDEPIRDASARTVERMASKPRQKLDKHSEVIDIGAGYGGSARYLASQFGCHVVALNLSEAENERDREKNREQGLEDLVTVVDGDFAAIDCPDAAFDLVWSQDAMLHSGNRERVLCEVARITKPGGEFIFTDPMHADGIDLGEIQPILDRLHLQSLGSPGFYRETLENLGFEELAFEEATEQLARHYSRVLQELRARRDELKASVSEEYIDRMDQGLQHWIEGGRKGNLAWGIFHFRKKA